jgi:hypothetical protein
MQSCSSRQVGWFGSKKGFPENNLDVGNTESLLQSGFFAIEACTKKTVFLRG